MAPIILMLGFVSGGVALAYEVLWTRELLNLLGSTTRASALVLAAFMSGLACGAYVAGLLATRIVRPLWLFAAAEGALAVIGFALPYTFNPVAQFLPNNGLLDAGLIVLLLAPALLMGVALPSLAGALQVSEALHLRHIARLYGLNTLGGAVAVLGVGFGALPAFGILASERHTVAVGLTLAAISAVLTARWSPNGSADQLQETRRPEDRVARQSLVAVGLALCLSGMAALGYEVLWTRILVLVVGSSSNAFTLMLGLYLLGLAVGGFWIGRVVGRVQRPVTTFQFLQLGVAVTALLGVGLFGFLPSAALFGFAKLGAMPVSIAIVNGLVAAVIILPPTILIGASFPVAVRLVERDKPRRGWEVGLALGLTTAGNFGGVLLTAFGLVPVVGLQKGVAALAVLNLAAALLLWVVTREISARFRYTIPATVVGALFVLPVLPAWDVAVMTSGVFRQAPVYLALLGRPDRLDRAFSAYRTLYYREGSEAVVGVFDRPTLGGSPHRVLTIDGKVDASTGADMATQVLSGYLPLLFQPDAKRALVIGLASGVTVGTLADHPLKRIDVVEIEPAMVAASHEFDDVSGEPFRDPRVRISIEDGRRYLRRKGRSFDIIVSEPSNPWLSMSARLFTREFFQLARERLGSRGILVQWIPLYGLSGGQFEVLLRTLLDVFPHLALFQVAEGDLVAVAGAGRLSIDPTSIDRLFEGVSADRLEAVGVHGPADLLVRWVADADGLRAALGAGPLNTDDNGLLEFGSPWYLLSDTRAANLSLVEKAWSHSSVSERIAGVGLSRLDHAELFEDIAARYITQGRPDMVHSLAEALRSSGDRVQADLLAGQAANAEGKWREAEALWGAHDAPPFRLRRARLAFRLGELAKATRLFAAVPQSQRSPEDDVVFALALTGITRGREALELMEGVSASPNTIVEIITPFVRFVLLKDLGAEKQANSEQRRFEQRLDALRRCLEADGCSGVVESLLQWGDNVPLGMENSDWENLRQSLFLRITRPLPHYFEGVRSLWLGEQDAAARSFRTYLKLLPKPDVLSKVHEFLASSVTPTRGNPPSFPAGRAPAAN